MSKDIISMKKNRKRSKSAKKKKMKKEKEEQQQQWQQQQKKTNLTSKYNHFQDVRRDTFSALSVQVPNNIACIYIFHLIICNTKITNIVPFYHTLVSALQLNYNASLKERFKNSMSIKLCNLENVNKRTTDNKDIKSKIEMTAYSVLSQMFNSFKYQMLYICNLTSVFSHHSYFL